MRFKKHSIIFILFLASFSSCTFRYSYYLTNLKEDYVIADLFFNKELTVGIHELKVSSWGKDQKLKFNDYENFDEKVEGHVKLKQENKMSITLPPNSVICLDYQITQPDKLLDYAIFYNGGKSDTVYFKRNNLNIKGRVVWYEVE